MSDNLIQALQKFQDEVVYVKAKTEGHHGKYAQFKDVVLSSKEGLKDNDLVINQTVQLIEGKTAIKTILTHASSKEFIESLHPLAYQGEDSQKQGSAITYAKRYSYVTILGLLVDTDDDGQLASTKDNSAVEEAKVKLGKSKTVDELRKSYMSLGPRLKANKEIVEHKDNLKDLLTEAN
jgi:hypothetical protein